MNLLIVDDEQIVLDSLSCEIDWSSAGIEEVFCCRNISEAKELLTKTAMDVVLCDIEIPGGNGLELLLWIQEQKIDVACIMLTCHADFEYSVQTLRLGGVDYILKPAENRVLVDAVSRAVEDRCKRHPRQISNQQYERFTQHLDAVLRHLWAEYLQQSSGSVSEALLAETGLTESDCLSLILLQFLSAVPKESLLQIRQLTERLSRWELELSGMQILCLGPAVTLEESAMYRNRCQELLKSCQALLGFPCNCILALSVPLAELPTAVAEMRSLAVRNVSMGNTILFLGDAPMTAERFLEPDPEVWRVLLQEGRLNEFIAEVQSTLTHYTSTGIVSQNELMAYTTNVMNVLYAFSRQHCTDDPDRLSLLMEQIGRGTTVRNLADFDSWLKAASSFVLRDAVLNDRERTVVRVKSYIQEHLGERLVCEQIARMVYLNVDYLERLFKRETGITITDYIAYCRIEMAKKLISDTSIPISSIAQEVGYTSFSYFSKLFRRSTGMSPRDYRRKTRQDHGDGANPSPDNTDAG